MEFVHRLKCLALTAAVAVSFGCSEDTTRPPAPPPPPSISLQPFTMSTGLPSNEVHDVLVDSQGRTWFSTNGGVALQVTGQPIQKFDDFDGIPNRQCRGLTEFNNKIWVATWGGGIGVYDGSPMWQKLDESDGLANNRVFATASDDTSLWIATVDGVSQYVDDDTRPMGDRWYDYSAQLATSSTITAILTHSLNVQRGPEIWLGSQDAGAMALRLPAITHVWGTRDDVFACGEYGTILRFNGTKWNRSDSRVNANLRGIWGANSNNMHAVGDGGVARFFNGQNWLTRNSTTTNRLNSVWGSRGDNVFAVGDRGTILRYNGNIWLPQQSPIENNLLGVFGASRNEVYAVGTNGAIVKYNGNRWKQIARGTVPGVTLRALWVASAGNVFAVGDNGTIVVSLDGAPRDDGKDQWTVMETPTTQNLYAVFGNAADDVFACGENGVMMHFNGSTWTLSASSTTRRLQGVWADAADNAYAAGSVGAFAHYDGATWSPEINGTQRFLKTVSFTEGNSKIPDSGVNEIVYDPISGLFWMAFASKGIGSFDAVSNAWTHIDQTQGLGSDLTYSLAFDQTTMWIGTQKGLTKWAGGTFTNFIKGSGLPDERVKSVFVDANVPTQKLWLGFVEGGAARVLNPAD